MIQFFYYPIPIGSGSSNDSRTDSLKKNVNCSWETILKHSPMQKKKNGKLTIYKQYFTFNDIDSDLFDEHIANCKLFVVALIAILPMSMWVYIHKS